LVFRTQGKGDITRREGEGEGQERLFRKRSLKKKKLGADTRDTPTKAEIIFDNGHKEPTDFVGKEKKN